MSTDTAFPSVSFQFHAFATADEIKPGLTVANRSEANEQRAVSPFATMLVVKVSEGDAEERVYTLARPHCYLRNGQLVTLTEEVHVTGFTRFRTHYVAYTTGRRGEPCVSAY